MNRQIIIVGGGASGLLAAISAARKGASVTILERMDRVLKKLMATGNGKCNMTNLVLSPECYRSDQANYPMQVLEQFGPEKTISFFYELGILAKNKNGYIYPNSQQASSVSDVLREEAERLRIQIICSCEVTSIKKKKKQFLIDTTKGSFEGTAVILAAGSMAAPVTGSDGSGYFLAQQFGHRLIKPLPALVQLRCEGKEFKQLAGIRADVNLELWIDREKSGTEQGELQITDYGVSGIPVFQFSRYAAKALDQGCNVEIFIDFLPQMSAKELDQHLKVRKNKLGFKTGETFLTGMINQKLAGVLMKKSGFMPDEPVKRSDPEKLRCLKQLLKAYPVRVIKTNSFVQAQVCCGGIDTTEVNPGSMESNLVSGLYLVGELLDVDGICGGYNLQWAWATGYIAGSHAASNSL